MIKSFKHKGLKELWERGRTGRIDSRPAVQARLLAYMERLNVVCNEEELQGIGKGVHKLQGRGDNHGDWAVWVTGNYRLTFDFDGQDAHILNYEDYH